MHGERWTRGAALAALVVALLLLCDAPASAHADLVASSPADGTALDASPREIVLKFTEAVDPATAAVNVETAMQQRVQAIRPAIWNGDSTALVVPVAKALRGSYVVFWRVTGTDGHVITGAFSFAVLAPVVKAAAPRPATEPGVQAMLTMTRGLTYGAMSALVGGVVLLLVAWPAGAEVARMRRFLWLALVVAAGATALNGSLSYAASNGTGLNALASPSLWVTSIRTHSGWVSAVRLVLLLLAGLLLADLDAGVRGRSKWWLAPAALVGVALVRTPGLVDHGASASPLESLAYFLHMAGIAVWVGGLLVIVLVLLPARREIEEMRPLLLRFSALATAALGLVVVSGAVLASPLLDNWRAVPSSEYGQLFLTKLALVATGVAIASRVRGWVRGNRGPRLAVANLVTETAIVLGVIAVTALLVGRSPALSPTVRNESTSITQKGLPVASPSS